jgi:hypothetical protein
VIINPKLGIRQYTHSTRKSHIYGLPIQLSLAHLSDHESSIQVLGQLSASVLVHIDHRSQLTIRCDADSCGF